MGLTMSVRMGGPSASCSSAAKEIGVQNDIERGRKMRILRGKGAYDESENRRAIGELQLGSVRGADEVDDRQVERQDE